MLRLAASRITLDSKDLALHLRRHEKRLEDGKQAKDGLLIPNAQRQHFSPRLEDVPNESWGSSRTRRRRRSPPEIPIYTDEPVPRDSQAFWDRIVADAGSSARIHQEPLARLPQVIVPSAASLENNGSVRLSIRGENENEDEQNQSVHPTQEVLISPRSPVSESSFTPSTETLSDRSQLSLEQTELYLSAKEDSDSDVTLENRQSRSPVGDSIDPQSPWANQMDLDGPSDVGPSLQHHRSTSSLQDPEPGSVGMPFGAQARRAELAASRNTASMTEGPLPYTEPRTFNLSSQTSYTSQKQPPQVRLTSIIYLQLDRKKWDRLTKAICYRCLEGVNEKNAVPQTPVGLPRHGIPPMPLQNPFFTAPARAGSRIRQGAAGWLHSAFATPSRAERGREAEGWMGRRGQENASVEMEAQRRERRERVVEEEEEGSMGTGRTRSGRAWRMSDWEQ
ncbi:MAG: hypothetical protein L6R35_004429 [Caloplaca aegaea]|nr:MAG: hypothetical protein L6R35_004429 [Caloplaca aegaea]